MIIIIIIVIENGHTNANSHNNVIITTITLIITADLRQRTPGDLLHQSLPTLRSEGARLGTADIV